MSELFNAGGIIVRMDENEASMQCYGAIGRWLDIDDRAFGGCMAVLDCKPITVHLNSEGGEVTTAMAIRQALGRHNAQVTIVIDGVAASAATLITCAKGARVVATTGSMLMIHSPLFDAGLANAEELRKVISALDACQESIVSVYKARTGLPEEQIIQLMEAETYMTAKDALKYGFIDEIDEEVRPEAKSESALSRVLGYSRTDYRRQNMKKIMNLEEEEQKKLPEEEEIKDEEKQEEPADECEKKPVDAEGEEIPEEEEKPEAPAPEKEEEEPVAEEEEKPVDAEGEDEDLPKEDESPKAWAQRLINKGIKMERRRIMQLESIAQPCDHKALFDAKFVHPLDKGQFAIALLEANNAKRQGYLDSRARDAEGIDSVAVQLNKGMKKTAERDVDDFINAARNAFNNRK